MIAQTTALMSFASCGMGALMSFHRRMQLQKAIVRVASPQSRVRDALEIARLHAVQRVADFMADGKATKIFLEPDLRSVFSLLDAGEQAVSKPRADAPQNAPPAST